MDEYFLQVVKEGEKVEWPRPEEDLVIGSQKLEGGYVQYWAYPKESGRESDDLPPAEATAQKHTIDKPTILIDRGGKKDETSEYFLELILVKDGHAWCKTESSLENLEDNLTSILESAKQKFNIKVEHFMTTDKVPSEVEKRLDDLEQGGSIDEEVVVGKQEVVAGSFKSQQLPTSGIYASNKPSGKIAKSYSKMWMMLPVVLILLIFGGVILFSDKSFPKFSFLASPTPTPTEIPTPTPIPTPSIDRSQIKVRVLNGTTETGLAAVLKGDLEEKGWQVVSIGNAAIFTVPQTYIKVKDGGEQAAAVMVADLSPRYEATSSANLKSTDTADLEVVIGKK